ncbi:putative polyprotein of retroviral origin [Ixodes scapularis]
MGNDKKTDEHKKDYLGFKIVKGYLKPGEAKQQAILEASPPTDVHRVKRFLGLTGFFRRFIPHYALKSEPLTRLTKKDTNFTWGIEQQETFDQLRKELTEPPILKLYDPSAPTEVHTDASMHGLAGMILQQDESGRWYLVFCVSKRTTDAEKNYHAGKLELMAVIWSMERLRPFLLGIPFTLVTDCQSIVYLNAHKTLKPQIARWFDLLQEYDFEVKHRAGEKMAHVDYLSREPVGASEDTLD